MAMLWAEDDTGLLVVAGVARKGKKAKPPKPEKKKKSGAMAAERPSMPGLPPPPANVSSARDSLLRPAPHGQPRPSVPIGVPIVPARGTTTGSQTGVHARHRSTSRRGDHKVARVLGWLFVLVVIAAGGFAVGALTDLGTQAEAFVLGPTPPPAPAFDPRVPALQADLDRTRAELAAERKTAEDLRSAAADASPIVDIEGEPAAADTAPVKKKHHHKHKKNGKIDL
jgi:hypothetical protein